MLLRQFPVRGGQYLYAFSFAFYGPGVEYRSETLSIAVGIAAGHLPAIIPD